MIMELVGTRHFSKEDGEITAGNLTVSAQWLADSTYVIRRIGRRNGYNEHTEYEDLLDKVLTLAENLRGHSVNL